MRSLLRATLLIAVVLAAPIVPFLMFGAAFEENVAAWFQRDLTHASRFTLIVLLLATDVFLPVPSSIVSTYGGGVLGLLPATLASWVGMTLGALAGFGLARLFGTALADRFARRRNRLQMAALAQRYGPVALVLVRGVPILAEASVLLMGIHRLPWHRFLPPILLSNLGIALAYSVFGDVAYEHQWLPLALAVSIALPILLATMVGRWLRTRDDGQGDRT